MRTGTQKSPGKAKNGSSRRFFPRSLKKALPQRIPVGGAYFPWLLGVALSLFLAAITTTGLYPPLLTYRVGDVARRDIKAPQDMHVQDAAATELLRQEARERVRPHYDLDTKFGDEVEGKIRTSFDAVQKAIRAQGDALRGAFLAERSSQRSPEVVSEARVREETYRAPAFLAAEEAFERTLQGAVTPRLAEWMREEAYAGWIRDDLVKLVRAALAPVIVSDRQLYETHMAKGIVVRDIRSGRRATLDSLVRPIELRAVEGLLRQRAGQLGLQTPPAMREALIGLASKLVRPTLTFNSRATVEAQQEETAKVQPVSQLIKEGEMIVREGERISESQIVKLKSLDRDDRQRHVLDNMLGTAAVSFLLLALSWVCAQRYLLSILRGPKTLMLFVILLASQALLVKLGIVVAHSLQDAYRQVAIQSFYFIIPFVSGPMLAALLQGRSAAVLMAVMTAGMTAMLLPGSVQYSLVALAGGIYAAIRWKNYRQRSSVLLACVAIGLINAALALGFNMQEGFSVAMARWMSVPLAFLGGLANVIAVSAAMPLLESLFKLTTDMRLLELTDQNHPVLRQLVVRAPGTYHHSLIVGNLAEEAAEAINAHPLLARVSAYFHDIGKIFKPEYFIENQGRENRHDRLTPNMSALILISHVKEGAELGREHKLPQEIIDMIAQHHGTSLIRYFYEKAKSAKGGDECREEAFCYPGPKPQTREAGILMLADIVEAASRTLPDSSPGRLAALVERAVQSAFVDGQLDECDLTLKDLGRIQAAFLRVLAGIHHHRVTYPGQPAPEKKGAPNGGVHPKPAKAGPARLAGFTAAGGGGSGKSPLGA